MLLRHGRTAHNADGRIQGQLDIPLDDVGREQAQAVALVLTALPPYAVLSSDLLRARGTAEPLAAAAGLPLRLDPRLRELDLGRWQGLTGAEAAERYPDEHAAWRAGRDVARGGGETYAAAGRRAAACLLDVDLPDGETLVAVTHGGTARAVLATLLELPHDLAWRFAALGNASWSVLVDAGRGWRLERHNLDAAPDPALARAAGKCAGATR